MNSLLLERFRDAIFVPPLMVAASLLLISGIADLRGSVIVMKPEAAEEEIAGADAVFEAEVKGVTKKLFVDGKEVSEKEYEKLVHPNPGTQRVVAARVEFSATFEVTKVYKGVDLKKGAEFSLEWGDLFNSMCPHSETRALRKSTVWSYRKGRDKPYKPFVSEAEKVMRKTIGGEAAEPQPTQAEQGGADQSATAVDSKAEGGEKAKLDSGVRSP